MFFERSRSDTMTVQPHVSLCRLQPSRDNVEQRRAFRSCTKIITRKLNHNLRARKKTHWKWPWCRPCRRPWPPDWSPPTPCPSFCRNARSSVGNWADIFAISVSCSEASAQTLLANWPRWHSAGVGCSWRWGLSRSWSATRPGWVWAPAAIRPRSSRSHLSCLACWVGKLWAGRIWGRCTCCQSARFSAHTVDASK